jgi:nucleotide-binding universal stress UspA family protein
VHAGARWIGALDASKGADLLTVGSRGLGDGDAQLGSVSHGVIAGAPCPVVVVPGEEHAAP